MRKLTTGFYQPTPSFTSIPEHIAVMDARDQTLVAICGAVDDDPANLIETMETARLFAAAPAMLQALKNARETIHNAQGDWHWVQEPNAPSWLRDLLQAEREINTVLAGLQGDKA